MLRSILAVLLHILALASATPLLAQDNIPVPTLAVPTLVPRDAVTPPFDALRTESAVADIVASGTFRVGILYNEPPYSELTLQGELRGFDVDLLRLIAETWGSEIEFVQVTRLNALERLESGEVHAVATALVHYRDLDDRADFSQTYLQGKQSILVRPGSEFAAPADLAEHTIGYVIGTRAEQALSLFGARLGEELQPQVYLTLDRAVAALTRGEVDGLVAEEQALRRATVDQTESVRFLEDPVLREARAFAVRRQDAPLRNLLNRTIQRLTLNQELEVLHREYFPDDGFPADLIALWDGIGEEVSPSSYSSAIAYPTRYAIPQILGSGLVRVGGISGDEESLPPGERRLAELNRALVLELASRWGVRAEFIASSVDEASELLSRGELDLIVGMKPDWSRAHALDFSMPYLLHGDRLMVRANSGILGFNNLRGRIVGLLIGDNTAQDRAQAWADSINARVRYFRTTENGAALTLLEFNNANAIYADSLALIAHLEANPNALSLTERWYSRSYYAFGTPHNDPDFRLLVDYSLQELIADGALYRLSAPLIVSDELPAFEIIPGSSIVAGINVSRSEAGSEP